MLTLQICDDAIEARLRERAAAAGHSPEDEAREVLVTALQSSTSKTPKDSSPDKSMVDEIQELFAPFGGVDLEILPRGRSSRVVPDFD